MLCSFKSLNAQIDFNFILQKDFIGTSNEILVDIDEVYKKSKTFQSCLHLFAIPSDNAQKNYFNKLE